MYSPNWPCWLNSLCRSLEAYVDLCSPWVSWSADKTRPPAPIGPKNPAIFIMKGENNAPKARRLTGLATLSIWEMWVENIEKKAKGAYEDGSDNASLHP